MARLGDIEDRIETYLTSLKAAYGESDPKHGEEGEVAKHEIAQRVIEVFWRLHGDLLVWAQAHMTGYAVLSENPELVSFLEEKLGCQLTEDSHALEQIGLQYVANPPDDNDPALNRMYEWLEEFNAAYPGDKENILSPTAIRRLIDEILMSRSANNSYWRFDLQNSLRRRDEATKDDKTQY